MHDYQDILAEPQKSDNKKAILIIAVACIAGFLLMCTCTTLYLISNTNVIDYLVKNAANKKHEQEMRDTYSSLTASDELYGRVAGRYVIDINEQVETVQGSSTITNIMIYSWIIDLDDSGSYSYELIDGFLEEVTDRSIGSYYVRKLESTDFDILKNVGIDFGEQDLDNTYIVYIARDGRMQGDLEILFSKCQNATSSWLISSMPQSALPFRAIVERTFIEPE
jgi:hypothetical protein